MQYDALTLNWFGGEAAADGSEAAADGTPTEATEETAENSAEKDAPSGAERSDADDAAQREEPPEMTEEEQRDIMRKAAAIARFNAAQAVVQRWEEEAEDLKQTYPAFSLEQSLRSDKGFASLLRAGVPVKLAYEAANLEKIVGAAFYICFDFIVVHGSLLSGRKDVRRFNVPLQETSALLHPTLFR